MQDATYCVKVRSKSDNQQYNATWSEWSPSTCWKNEAGEGKEPLFFNEKLHGAVK